MNELSYETIKQKINTYYKEKAILEKKVEDDNQKKSILANIFNSINQDLVIKDLYITELIGDINILKYKIIDKEKNIEIDTIVLTKDNNPIIKIENNSKKNKDTVYCNTTYSIYIENSHYLMNKFHTTTLINQNFATTKVTILNNIHHNTREYYQKEYIFYENNSKIIAIQFKNKMYIEMEAEFENTLLTAHKLIDSISSNIIRTLNNIIFDDQVKEYKINRKIKK